MRVLTVNAGSSSLKLSLLNGSDVVDRHEEIAVGTAGIDIGELGAILGDWPRPDAVGHRIVHGGRLFADAVVIDPVVERQLRALSELAPLHQPRSLAAMDAVARLLPDVVSVACFDTAFHADLPLEASTYAVPVEWREAYGIRRYGFHGLSHAYCSRRSAELLGRQDDRLRIVTCHLGSGASLAAVQGGRSVDTTMGFTPLDGLVMATRSGSLDPGLLLWLEQQQHVPADVIATALEHHSGLLALAGTADMRRVETAAARGEAGAVLALDVYIHSLVAGVAAMTAAMGGIDVLAFTGGVGENSTEVRARAARRLRFLGVDVDPAADATAGDRDVTAPGATVSTVVIAAREDLQIAREVRSALALTRTPEPRQKETP